MQRRTKFALFAVGALAAAGVIAGAAAANQGWRMGHHGFGGLDMAAMTARYDANKDGKLSQAEIDDNRAQWLKDFDADKNGTLALAEFQNLWLKARNAQMVREFQEFDANGDGQVTLDEYKKPMAGLVAAMDSNGDGLLSSDDHMRRHGHVEERQ
jgi:EF hand